MSQPNNFRPSIKGRNYSEARDILKQTETWLIDQFGKLRSCHCGAVSPVVGTIFEVVEPSETCHATSGFGLDADHNVPPGIYEVTENEVRYGGQSHYMTLLGLKTGKKLGFYSGYSNGLALPFFSDMMDWRGIRKPQPEVPEPLTYTEWQILFALANPDTGNGLPWLMEEKLPILAIKGIETFSRLIKLGLVQIWKGAAMDGVAITPRGRGLVSIFAPEISQRT